MIKNISFFILVIIFFISAEWYQSQIIVMESWAYILKSNTIAKEDTIANVGSDTIENTTIQDDTNTDSSYSNNNKSELIVKNLAIEMFSGVIYGYDFSYAPPNSNRKIQEDWTFEPVAKISFYDTHLTEIERNILNDELRIFYRYNLLDQQVKLLQSWEENSKVLYSKGEGISLNNNSFSDDITISSEIEYGYTDSRIDALYDAIQSAIRNRLKDTLSKRTRMVEGRVRLASQPFFTDHFSYYTARAKIMLYIRNIDFYEEF